METMSFSVACLKYFGKKPNQTNSDFMAEMRALTDKDRDDLTKMFLTVGIRIG